MLVPKRGTYLCKVIDRIKELPSGLFIADKIKSDRNDNFARCIGMGNPAIDKKGKSKPLLPCRGAIIHYKMNFGKKFNYEGKHYISLKEDEVIAIERDDGLHAIGSMVIVKLIYQEKQGSIYMPQGATQQNSGEYYGKAISIGPDYPDKNLRVGDKVVYLRSEGYAFRPYNNIDTKELLAVKECWIYGKWSSVA